jgi:uncharacterized protein (TIGR04255 family)
VRFSPHQATNAIVLASFACEFAVPLDISKLKQIGDLYPKLKDELPQKIEQPAVTFHIVEGTQRPSPVQTIGAIAFSSYERDGSMVRQFNATPVLMSFAEMKYTGWESVWPRARDVLNLALDTIGDTAISAFGLEYQDRFQAEGSPTDALDISHVLEPKSEYLPPRIFGLKDVWHVQEGSVEERDRPQPHTSNDNVSVGLVRRRDLPPPQLALEITLQHRRVFKQPARAHSARSLMQEFFDEMHTCNKAIMENLLVPEMAKRIGIVKEAA